MRHAGSVQAARTALARGRARHGADVVPVLDPNKDMRLAECQKWRCVLDSSGGHSAAYA